MNKTAILSFSLSSILLFSCKPSPESALIGKWTVRDEVRIGKHEFNVSTTFNSDHTFVSETYDRLPPHSYSKVEKGSWKIKGNSLTLSSDTVAESGSKDMQADIISLTDNLLVISSTGSTKLKPQTTTLERVQ